MIYIFPESAIKPGNVDPDYLVQFNELNNIGLKTALVDEQGKLINRNSNSKVGLYRGWMMTESEYFDFYNKLSRQGITLINTPQQYVECHYISGWYNRISDLTIPSHLYKEESEITKDSLPKWQRFFVKDYVKSLTTTRGSVANNISEIHEIISLIKKFRGKIDGGLCIREFIELCAGSEERHFVLNGRVFSRDGINSSIAKKASKFLCSNFYSIDTCFDKNGNELIVELGDGQVSDYKNWDIKSFIKIFAAQQGDAPEPATNVHSALPSSQPPAR